MAKYVALLRGINVGGNSIVKMSELKAAFEKNGFINVATYINSGNVIFESEETNTEKLTFQIEKMLLTNFKMNLRVVIRSQEQLKTVVSNVSDAWKNAKDFRCYIAFVKEPTTPNEVIQEIQLKAGVDFVKAGKHVVYMATKMEGLTKSGFTKLVGKKIYKEITMRNFNTTKKLLELMEGK